MEFTEKEFEQALRIYHNSIWPMPAILFFIGVFIVALIIFNFPVKRRLILGGLAFLWLWCGTIFMTYFISGLISHTTFAPQAFFFSIQGVLFIFALKKENQILDFNYESKTATTIGMMISWFALIAAPLIGTITGKFYPHAPAFGDPCPLTIFTFGILMCSSSKIPWYYLIIPFCWSLTGLIGVIELGIYDDFIEFIVGIFVTGFILYRNYKLSKNK